MSLRRLKYLLTILLLTAFGAGAQMSLQLIKPDNVVEGRKFSLTYRLKNCPDGASMPRPTLPGCSYVTGPWESTMSSYSYVNGHQSQSFAIDYTYTYKADKAGTVKVPSMSVTVNGRTLTAPGASFTVYPPDRTGPGTASGAPTRQQVEVDDVNTQSPGPVTSNELLVRISLSKSRVYEQEAVICTIKVYTKLSISGFMVINQPSFDGFVSEELPVDTSLHPESLNGQNYYAATLKRAILYPQKSGTLTINSGKYDITVVQYERQQMGYFMSQVPVEKRLTTSSNSTSIVVTPLPQPQPEGFNGAVGHYSLSASLTPKTLKTNESAVYRLSISGTGNIKLIKEPEVAFPPSFDTFTPSSDVQASFNGSDMSGTDNIDYTLVPKEVGDYAIPSLPFVYFDPSTGQYVTLHTQAFSGKVLKGSDVPPDMGQKAVVKAMTDILYIKTRHGDTVANPDRALMYSPVYWLMYALLALALLVVLVAYRRQMRLRADTRRLRESRAMRMARRRLRKASKAMKEGRSEAFFQELSAALFGFISDKLGIPASALIRDNIAAQLSDLGAGEADIAEIISLLDQCEMARFTPMGTPQTMSDLYNQALGVIERLSSLKRQSSKTSAPS